MSVQVLSPSVKPLRVARSRSEVGKSWQPYWDGLRRAVLFMEGGGVKARDLSPNRRIFDLQSGVSWNRSRFGRVADFDGTANAYADLSETVLYQPPFTVFTLFLVRDHNGKTLWSNAESGDTNTFHHLIVQFDGGSTPNVLIANTWVDGSGDFATSGAAGTTVVTENEWHTGAGVWAATDDRRVFLDGIREGTNTTTRNPGTRPDSEDIGRLGDSTPSQQADGLISLTYTWTRALNDTQISRLHIDPFGPFRPARRVAVIVPAGAVTVIPDSISGTWATQDPTLSFGGITQLPTSVAGTWSTQDPTLTFTFFPASVSGTWASQNPALSFGAITQSPASVSGTWATQDPALTFGAITVSPVSVSGTWSTQDPTVVSGLQTITPPAVTGSWASQAPSMSFGAITRSPSEIAGTWAVSAVATAFGGVTVSAASVSGTWATQPVSSTLGATTKTPAAVSGTWNSRAPTLTGGAVTFSPASISGTWAVSTLTVVTGVFTVVSPTSGSITSTVTTGSITSTTTSATITTTDTSADIDSEV